MGGNYFGRHWRGEMSLARSFWLNHVAIGSLLSAALALGVARTVRSLGEQPVLVLYLVSSFLLLWLYAEAWQIVGTWRSALSARDNGRAVRAVIVQGLLVLAALGCVATVIGDMAPSLRAVLHGTPVAVAGTTVRDHGRRLDFYGPVGPRSASDFRRALAAAPAARLVRLESGGGNVGKAREIADMVRAAGLDTEVTQECASACTIMFFGGRNRWLRDGARLGFHSYSSAAMTPQEIVRDEDFERRSYAAAGVSPAFIERIFSVPPARVWYPTRGEAEAAGFATRAAADPAADPSPTSPP